MNNGMDPGQMTPVERLDEMATILASAMLRLWKRTKARAFSRDNCLGIAGPMRPPVTAG